MTAGNAKEACDVIYPRSVHELDTQEPRSYVFVRGYSFRSHYERETLMRTKGFLLILIAGLGVALICPELSLLRGQAPTSVGLTGQVTSKAKGLSSQLTNAEWLVSMPGTEEQKSFLLNCKTCHTIERIAKSTHDADEWMPLFERMASYAPGSDPTHPQKRILVNEGFAN